MEVWLFFPGGERQQDSTGYDNTPSKEEYLGFCTGVPVGLRHMQAQLVTCVVDLSFQPLLRSS